MYKRKSKYSVEQNQMWSVAAFTVLCESSDCMTCEQIRLADLTLVDVTPQKMSRILNELVENGFVVKTKGKDGRMRYKAVSVLIEQGYDVEHMVY